MNDVAGIGAPDVSVVLATYDRRHSLPRAIASVLAHAGVRSHLSARAAASGDAPAVLPPPLRAPRIRTFPAASNGGPSAARNPALGAPRAGIVAFLDSDDASLPYRLAAPLAAFAADSS